MAHIRTPLIQTYSNPFSLCLRPASIVHLCVSQDPKSPRQNSEKKQVSPKQNKKFYHYKIQNQGSYHKMMNNYLARNINTLTNLKSQDNDFANNSGIVHALQLNRLIDNQLEQIETVFSFFDQDPLSTRIQSPRSIAQSQISMILDLESTEAQKFQQKSY